MEALTQSLAGDFPRAESFVEAVKTAVELHQARGTDFTDWLREALQQVGAPEAAALERAASEWDMPAARLTAARQAVEYVLLRQHRRDLSREHTSRGLQEVGVPNEVADGMVELCAALSDVKPVVSRLERSASHASAGVQAVQTVAALCDLRAIFDENPSRGLEAGEPDQDDFLGWVPVVLVSFDVSESPFEERLVTYQLSEAQLSGLISLLQAAERRLRELRGRVVPGDGSDD